MEQYQRDNMLHNENVTAKCISSLINKCIYGVMIVDKSIVEVMQTYANHPNNLENLKR